MIHDLVKSDWFALIVGAAGIVAAFAAVAALFKINSIVTQNNKGSNKIKRLSQKAKGDNISQAGRDNR